MANESLAVKISSQSTVHLLPCSIEYDGTAPVKSFFHVTHEVDQTMRSHLRGRELKGRTIELDAPLPQNSEVGLAAVKILQHDKANIIGLCVGDSGNKNWVVEGQFTTLNVWEHDTLPDISLVDDRLSWFSIADSVSE